jgi:hypothetical protein
MDSSSKAVDMERIKKIIEEISRKEGFDLVRYEDLKSSMKVDIPQDDPLSSILLVNKEFPARIAPLYQKRPDLVELVLRKRILHERGHVKYFPKLFQQLAILYAAVKLGDDLLKAIKAGAVLTGFEYAKFRGRKEELEYFAKHGDRLLEEWYPWIRESIRKRLKRSIERDLKELL